MGDIHRPRRYYLLKARTADSVGDWSLGDVWRSKQAEEPGSELPVGFTLRTRLTAAGYTTTEDLDGADLKELRACGFTLSEASAILAELAQLLLSINQDPIQPACTVQLPASGFANTGHAGTERAAFVFGNTNTAAIIPPPGVLGAALFSAWPTAAGWSAGGLVMLVQRDGVTVAQSEPIGPGGGDNWIDLSLIPEITFDGLQYLRARVAVPGDFDTGATSVLFACLISVRVNGPG